MSRARNGRAVGSAVAPEGIASERVPLETMPDVMTVREAMSVLGIGRNTLYESIHRNEIPAVRFGRRLLVPKAALQRMLETAAGVG